MAQTSGNSQGEVVGGGSTNTSGGNSSAKQGFFNSQQFGAIMGTAGGVANQFKTPRADLNSTNQTMASVREGVSDALISSGNPYAIAAGAAVKVIDKTGGFSDGSEGLGRGNDIGNVAMSFLLPGAGWFINKTDEYKMSDEMKAMQSGYASTVKNNSKAASNSGGKFFFGQDKANSMIHVAQNKDKLISNIKENTDNAYQTMASMTQTNAMRTQNDYTGGYQQALARAGKFGMKIERAKQLIQPKPLEEIITFKVGGAIEPLNVHTPEEDDAFFSSITFDFSEPVEVPEFKEGGQMNVIPEGNLHARLHHMESSEEITKKGIPVIDKEGHQQAEIEVNEIIFNLEVTQKLEELEKKYRKEETSAKEKVELAIEAGKLLAEEIMTNTDDRTGLIQTVE